LEIHFATSPWDERLCYSLGHRWCYLDVAFGVGLRGVEGGGTLLSSRHGRRHGLGCMVNVGHAYRDHGGMTGERHCEVVACWRECEAV
jgi:hypothetical protein